MNRVVERERTSPGAAAGAILAVLVLVGVLPACSAQGGNAAAAADPKAPGAVAEIDGKPVSQAELDELAAPHLKQLEAQRQKILDGVLNQLIEKKLIEAEAAERGISTEELERAEVAGKVAEVTDAEVDAWYEENKERVRQPKEQVVPQIKSFLANQRQGEARTAFLASLRKEHKVRILLEPPREKVEVAGAPTKGPASAPITIVEFSDFECPYCGRLNPTIEQVLTTYGDRVRIAFRQFPLAMHPNAQKAAEASLCAHDQGKFWQMHDAMFANQRELAVDKLKARAVELQLDAESFNQCLDSGKHATKVADDLKAGQAVGVSGTPAMFINGRMVSGAVPFDQVAAVIDDELARQSGG